MFTKLKELFAAFVVTPNKYPLFWFSAEQQKIKSKCSLIKVIRLHWKSLLLPLFPEARELDALTGDTQIGTGDLLICSQMLHHWAIPPAIELTN